MSSTNLKIETPDVFIAQVDEQLGKGVFATRHFQCDEIVEVAPVFLLEEKFNQLPVAFQQRVFNWGYLTRSVPLSALVLGYGSLYNHSDEPNLRYEADPDELVMRYVARRDIAPLEQLTVHYNQLRDGKLSQEAKWFEITGIEKHGA